MTGGSRFGAPRGSVPRIVAEAADLAEERLSLTMKLLDDATTAGKIGTLGGGNRLAYDAFRALLTSDEGFRQQVANRWLFATPSERERLLQEIQRVFPAGRVTGTAAAGTGSAGLPPEVVSPPPSPGGVPADQRQPGAEMGMGLGGPLPGAAPASGAAPPPGSGAGLPPAPAVPPLSVTPLQQLPPPPGPLPMPPPAPGAPGVPPVLGLLPGMAPPPSPLPIGPDGQPLPPVMPAPPLPLPPGM
jgi:hypothetical protein